ncbi:hypothetical protein ACLOJK_022382 [Asimina triloba]
MNFSTLLEHRNQYSIFPNRPSSPPILAGDRPTADPFGPPSRQRSRRRRIRCPPVRSPSHLRPTNPSCCRRQHSLPQHRREKPTRIQQHLIFKLANSTVSAAADGKKKPAPSAPENLPIDGNPSTITAPARSRLQNPGRPCILAVN